MENAKPLTNNNPFNAPEDFVIRAEQIMKKLLCARNGEIYTGVEILPHRPEYACINGNRYDVFKATGRGDKDLKECLLIALDLHIKNDKKMGNEELLERHLKRKAEIEQDM